MTQRSKFPSSFFWLSWYSTKLLDLCNPVISQSVDVTTPNHHHVLTRFLVSQATPAQRHIRHALWCLSQQLQWLWLLLLSLSSERRHLPGRPVWKLRICCTILLKRLWCHRYVVEKDQDDGLWTECVCHLTTLVIEIYFLCLLFH